MIKKPIFFELRFLDTYAFMASSIDSSSENLKSSCKNVSELRKIFKNISNHFTDDNQFLLMTEKGIYPDDYIDI